MLIKFLIGAGVSILMVGIFIGIINIGFLLAESGHKYIAWIYIFIIIGVT